MENKKKKHSQSKLGGRSGQRERLNHIVPQIEIDITKPQS
jgi:hypothetical protein